MRIIRYEYSSPVDDHWHFPSVEFKKVNLLVGDTGTGKTRLLNTIFNLGTIAANRKSEVLQGIWDIVFEHEGRKYRWHLEVANKPPKGNLVVGDNIWTIDDSGGEQPLVERDLTTFRLAGRQMPKLAQDQTSVLLLQDEELLHPLYEGFSVIMRRRFSQDELQRVAEYNVVGQDFLQHIQKERNLKEIFGSGLGLNARLLVLQRFFPDVFNRIVRHFQSTFPFVIDTRVIDTQEARNEGSPAGLVPEFSVKEKHVGKWIKLAELSSGMQKVLLVLTDIHLLPPRAVYLVDEYENSLGVGAIDFLPSILYDPEHDHQFIITSHHPYIINNIPVKDWYILHRRGSEVSIRYGDELAERYGRSKQDAFIKLINDPFYKSGVAG